MDTVKIQKNNVKMVAHRGVSGLETENTCSAFVAAGNRSYFGVETDVHVTSDGRFVIIHDDWTGRVSGERVNINVEKSDFAEIEPIRLPDIDGSFGRRDIVIPQLNDYIAICRKYEKTCVLELKNHFDPAVIEIMLGEIRKTGYLSHIIFISFDLENVVNLRRLLPDQPIQWLLCAPITDEIFGTLKQHRLDLDVCWSELSAEIVSRLHAQGTLVNCWTVDDPAVAEKLVAMGVDFITTNILE